MLMWSIFVPISKELKMSVEWFVQNDYNVPIAEDIGTDYSNSFEG